MRFILFLMIFILSNSSCEESDSEKKGKPCPDFLICNNAGIKSLEMHISGFIEDDKFIAQNISYCSYHYYPSDGKPEKQGDFIDYLKARVYNWDESISYEDFVYLLEEQQEINKKQVVIYLSDTLSHGQIVKIVRLNEQDEEIKTLVEIKPEDIPKGESPYFKAYDCKKQPFTLTQE